MKKLYQLYFILLAIISFSSLNVYAQVGIGIINNTNESLLTLKNTNYTNALEINGNTVINGNFQIKDGTQGLGKVLVSDANGNASWQNLSIGNPKKSQIILIEQTISNQDNLTTTNLNYTGENVFNVNTINDTFVLEPNKNYQITISFNFTELNAQYRERTRTRDRFWFIVGWGNWSDWSNWSNWSNLRTAVPFGDFGLYQNNNSINNSQYTTNETQNPRPNTSTLTFILTTNNTNSIFNYKFSNRNFSLVTNITNTNIGFLEEIQTQIQSEQKNTSITITGGTITVQEL